MASLAKQLVLLLAERNQLIRRTAAFIVRNTSSPEARDTYGYLKARFIENGARCRFGRAVRSEIVGRFETIDREVPTATTGTDGLVLAEMLLNIDADGAIVECGCYAGASSAKLSIIAKLQKRELHIFDSFAGLPACESRFLRDKHCRRSDTWVTEWTAGRYAVPQAQVEAAIESFGEPSVCRFVKGWFSDTLNDDNLPKRVAMAFVDVDVATSARDCFVPLWPRLSPNGVYVTHDTAYLGVLQELLNPRLWAEEFKAIPPILFGAGFGLYDGSPHIGYMVKGDSLATEYLKRLTIDK